MEIEKSHLKWVSQVEDISLVRTVIGAFMPNNTKYVILIVSSCGTFRVNALLAWSSTPGLGGPVLLAAVCGDATFCNIHIKESGINT